MSFSAKNKGKKTKQAIKPQHQQDSALPIKPLTFEELQNHKALDVRSIYVLEDPTPPGPELCRASTWDSHQVSDWATQKRLPATASSLQRHQINGVELLRLDALALQRMGVCSGREALMAEEHICRLAGSLEREKGDSSGLPVEMYKSLYRGEAPCPGYPPLDMLTSDPWVSRRARFLDPSDHCNLEWMGIDRID